ncbi:hypothetical protein PT974_08231 [Cladobotryum mycophilum]|uniref:F-box domain-containing protein n=1 Tax=Cladobotryum mycophilum TaxID=491253 RepID=A0ABR0SCU6_9HYPO
MESQMKIKTVPDVRHLPTLVLLEVIKLCSDFTTLHSLLLASRTFASIFNDNARTITEAIMASSVPEQIQAPMRAVVRIRTRTHGCQNVGEVKDTLLDIKNMKPLPDIQETALLRKFVALAHQIHSLTHTCLEYYMEKCQALKPSRLKDPTFRYIPVSRKAWPMRPPGERYQLPILNPPSWIEEQGVLMNLWRFQAFYELQTARAKQQLGWTSIEIDDLEAMSILDFYDFRVHQLDQLLTVKEFIDDLRQMTHNTQYSKLPQVSSENGCFSLVCSPEPHFENLRDDKWDQSRWYIDKRTIGWIFHRMMSIGWRSPLEDSEFTPYRKYGFAIWDRERMVNLGFLPERKSDMVVNDSPLSFIWRSILSKEEDEAIREASMSR